MRGMATLPQQLLVVRDKVGRPPVELGVSKSMECDTFPFSALTLLVGRQEDPNHLNLPFLITKLTGSSYNSSLLSAFFPLFQFTHHLNLCSFSSIIHHLVLLAAAISSVVPHSSRPLLKLSNIWPG